MESLTHEGRPSRVEVACSEHRVLSQEVEKRFGIGSAVRCGLPNGCDAERQSGLEVIKGLLKQHRPVHVYSSCDCGPFCPHQRLNQRDDSQVRALQAKSKRALLQYQGAQEVAHLAAKLGSQIHWEWSETSEAWKLEQSEKFLEKHSLRKVTCHGCCIGLRTRDNKQLLCRWTIATKNTAILKHMHLVCQKNHACTWPASSEKRDPQF